MNKELLQLLACPRCRGTLELVEEKGVEQGLSCAACAVLYPIRDAIPVMLIEEAQPLNGAGASALQGNSGQGNNNQPLNDQNGEGPCACS